MIIRSYAKQVKGRPYILCVGDIPAKARRRKESEGKLCLYLEKADNYQILAYFVSKEKALEFVKWMESIND
jgi:hypothetical protein